MNIDQALTTFLEESRELLQQMEDALMYLETSEQDEDTVNAMFRAAHTIKGSAGLFGLDGVVSFTHVVENILDQVRSGEIRITPELVALLLPCSDHIGTLINESMDINSKPSEELLADGEQLLGKLRIFSKQTSDNIVKDNESETLPLATQTTNPVEMDRNDQFVATDSWHISLRFGEDVLRNGMDPASFLRYLGKLGEIAHVTTLFDKMPETDNMDPESCYLGFEIDFKSNATKKEIEEVFEFVREDCRLRILSPNSRISDYIQLICDLPEGEEKLGQILIQSGALTQRELEDGLARQTVQASNKPEAPLIGKILVDQGMVQQPVVDAAVAKQQNVRERKPQESRLIRVQADKLDALINLVGELVIAGASASLLAQRAGDDALLEATSTMSRLVEEIRDGALQLRMVQIGETFHRFQRVVRDVSKELGKDIDLIISGAETELDKTVVEKISDPLMHLVRNSMDHGIEAADLRIARGKPRKGHLRLNAYHDSGSIVIEVADDGGGLNKERILQKALEREVITSTHNLSDKEIFNLIFEPGFSTSDQVSNLSGRGVGMDVVRRNIEALRGSVDLDSVEGSSTTVRIRLPLTLAIIDGFLVGVSNNAYVVPLDMVMECVELTPEQQQSSRATNYINLRGEVLPFIRLRDIFGVEDAPPRRESIVVMQYAGQQAGLMVDTLMGEFQTVIKPMGKLFTHLKGIAGSTILGSGDVALILDVPSLVLRAVNAETHAASLKSPALATTAKSNILAISKGDQ
jgi:two-component system chemotaxis sensor kinase CheA